MPVKVLVIDDDEDFRASVRSLLESKDYAVIEADCAKAGLAKLVAEKPHLITVDVMMTCDTDGYSVSHAVRHREEYREFAAIPIIMISSIQSSPDELYPMSPEAELIRPDIYMTKPLDIPEFLAVIERAAAVSTQH